MSNNVTASLVINFNANGANGILAAEIDGRADGYNKGKTSFAPGEDPAFLVFKSDDVTIDSVIPSAGSIATLTGGVMSVTDTLQFADTDEATLSKPYESGFTSKWLGTSLGAVTRVGATKLVAANRGVGVLKVTYNTRFYAYRLSNVPNPLNGETEYIVLIVISGTQT